MRTAHRGGLSTRMEISRRSRTTAVSWPARSRAVTPEGRFAVRLAYWTDLIAFAPAVPGCCLAQDSGRSPDRTASRSRGFGGLVRDPARREAARRRGRGRSGRALTTRAYQYRPSGMLILGVGRGTFANRSLVVARHGAPLVLVGWVSAAHVNTSPSSAVLISSQACNHREAASPRGRTRPRSQRDRVPGSTCRTSANSATDRSAASRRRRPWPWVSRRARTVVTISSMGLRIKGNGRT